MHGCVCICACIHACVCAYVHVCVRACCLCLEKQEIRIHISTTSQAALLPKGGADNTGPDQKEGALGLVLSQAAPGPWVYTFFLFSRRDPSTCLEEAKWGTVLAQESSESC